MKRKYPLLFVAGFFAGTISVKAGELTLLMDSVSGRSPAVKAAEAQAESARYGLREARYRSLPQLRAESMLTRGDNPVYAFGTLLQQRAFESRYFDVGFLNDPGYLTDIRSSLELGVPIFTGFALQNGRRMASLGVKQAEQQVESASQGTRFRIVDAYLTAMLKSDQIASLDRRIVEASGEVEDANRLKSKGFVLGSDYYAAEAILEGLKAWRAQLEAARNAAASEIAILSGEPLSAALAFRLSESTYPVQSESAHTADALRSRSDVQSAALQSESAGVARRLETASILPRVEAFASLATHTEDFSSNPSERMLGVRASLPFGDPTYLARRKRANFSARAGLSYRESVEENARVEVAQSLAGYNGALSSLDPARRTRDRAAKSLSLFRPLYREGRQSIIEVLRAEEGLARAEANYLESLYHIHAGYARLLFATGRLDRSAVAEIENHLEVVR